MTGRRLKVAAGAALVVAVIAAAVSPFLHHGRPVGPVPVGRGQGLGLPVPAEVTPVAATAAVRALACQPLVPAPHPSPAGIGADAPAGWCGRLTITRSQANCATAIDSCQVELIGTLTAPDASTVLALRVIVQSSGAGWQAAAVSS
jgi:hypothetical protein